MRKTGLFAILLGFAVLAVSGCAKKAEPGNELVMLCGSSFTLPMEQLSARFTDATGIKIVTTVAGSEVFLPQVKAAEQGDILVTHDPFLDLVKEAGKYSDHVQVGFVAPVLAVQKGNPKGLAKIEDLTQEGLKVGLTDPNHSRSSSNSSEKTARKSSPNTAM
ncbi:MAG: substrate-binding domain-containing protein [Planctomycetes bacterium]|nr:substrate-binding domain-containing protein [Planctomycetota bacterium]